MAPNYHFVLVHGMGHGAWCWYKVTAQLEAAGHKVTSVDLTSNGVSKVAADKVKTLAQHALPLTDVMSSVEDDGSVVLVGHSLGGSVISYAMDLFPRKIHAAVYVAALMPIDGDAVLPDEYKQPLVDNGLLQVTPAVAGFIFPKSIDHLYSRSPAEDVALAKSALTLTPSAPFSEKLRLRADKYGSVHRHYIATVDDQALPIALQEQISQRNPGASFHRLAESDHSPFFSQPRGLVDLLLSIASQEE